MTKLKGILLTQGMHGMISQVEGLAKALDVDFTHHTVVLNNYWKIQPILIQIHSVQTPRHPQASRSLGYLLSTTR